MKKFILAGLVVLAFGMSSFAQCDKKVIVTSSKTEYLDANGEVQRSVDEVTTVEFDKKDIIITPGDNPSMQGTIDSMTCDWKTPFKEGKTVIKTSITNPQGQTFGLTITIEGKEGKITFLAEMAEMPDQKIRIVVEKFEEKK
jgi:hypothetical protein